MQAVSNSRSSSAGLELILLLSSSAADHEMGVLDAKAAARVHGSPSAAPTAAHVGLESSVAGADAQKL